MRLTNVSPPTDPSERARFIRFAPRPASGVGRSFRRRLFASAVAPLDALRLLPRHLLEIGPGEIDWIEQERRESAVADRFGDNLAREREDQPRRLDQQERLEGISRNVADPEQTTVAQIHDKMDAVV